MCVDLSVYSMWQSLMYNVCGPERVSNVAKCVWTLVCIQCGKVCVDLSGPERVFNVAYKVREP